MGTFQRDAPESARGLFRKHAMGNSCFKISIMALLGTRPVRQGLGWVAGRGRAMPGILIMTAYPDLYVTNGMISGPRRPTQADDLNSFFLAAGGGSLLPLEAGSFPRLRTGVERAERTDPLRPYLERL